MSDKESSVRIFDMAVTGAIGSAAIHERTCHMVETEAPDGSPMLTCSECGVQVADYMACVKLSGRYGIIRHYPSFRPGCGAGVMPDD